jgi:hypothetical protein
VHGRLYTLQLWRGGIRFVLTAYNFHPEHREWQFMENEDVAPGDEEPAHLIMQLDGALEPDIGLGRDEAERIFWVAEEGRTVRDLVPADDLARELWATKFGNPTVCPRCDAPQGTPHHPLCFTDYGVPLSPYYDRNDWRSSIREQCAHWEQEIALAV